MLGQDIDRFVSDNASHCEWCRKLARQISNKWTDLNQATRRASGDRSGARRNIIAVRKAKAALQEQRQEAELHIKEHS